MTNINESNKNVFSDIYSVIFPTTLTMLMPDLLDVHHIILSFLQKLMPDKTLYENNDGKYYIYREEIEWINSLSIQKPSDKINYKEYANSIKERIKKARKVEVYSLQLAIIANVGVERNLNLGIFNELKTITLLSVIKILKNVNFRGNESTNSSVKEVVLNIRRFQDGARRNFAKMISEIDFSLSIDSIKNEFVKLYDPSKNDVSNRVLSSLIVIFELILGAGKGGGGGRNYKTKIEVDAVFQVDGCTVERLVEIDYLSNRDKTAHSEQEDQRGLITRKVSYLISPRERLADLKVNQWRAASIALSMSIRTQSLPCDIGQLSECQVKTLSQHFIQQIKIGNNVYGLLLIMVLLGKTIQDLQNLKIYTETEYNQSINSNKFDSIINNDDVFFAFRTVKVAHGKIHAKLNKDLIPIDEKLKLNLPTILKHIMNNGSKLDVTESALRQELDKASTKTGIQITLSQLSNYLSNWLQRHCVDQAIMGVLTEKTVKQCAPMAYSRIPIHKINTIWMEYLLSLGILSDDVNTENIVNVMKYVGSRLYPEHDTLQIKIKNLQDSLQYIKSLKNIARTDEASKIIDFHNLFIKYTLLILNLSTGARPVTDMYGTVENYCLKSKFIRISDKEARSVPAGRFLPLTNIAVKQLDNLESYLKQLSDKFKFSYENIACAAHDAINSNGPFLFWLQHVETIHEENVRNKIIVEQVSPRSLLQHFDHDFPYPVNWHRHAVRTRLMMCDEISSALVDHVMGHENMGHEYANLFSGSSLQDLRIVSEHLNDWLNSLGLTALEAKVW